MWTSTSPKKFNKHYLEYVLFSRQYIVNNKAYGSFEAFFISPSIYSLMLSEWGYILDIITEKNILKFGVVAGFRGTSFVVCNLPQDLIIGLSGQNLVLFRSDKSITTEKINHPPSFNFFKKCSNCGARIIEAVKNNTLSCDEANIHSIIT